MSFLELLSKQREISEDRMKDYNNMIEKPNYKYGRPEKINVEENINEIIKDYESNLNHENVNKGIDMISKTKIKDKLKNLIEQTHTQYTSENYHAERAIEHYKATKDAHSRGQAYFEKMSDIYFLNDDLSDNKVHFHMAMERLRINNREIDNRLVELKSMYGVSSVYNIDQYW